MEFYANIDRGRGQKTGTIHWKDCTWANPTVKTSPTEFWFATLTLDAARRIVAGLGARENIHDFCIDLDTFEPRQRAST